MPPSWTPQGATDAIHVEAGSWWVTHATLEFREEGPDIIPTSASLGVRAPHAPGGRHVLFPGRVRIGAREITQPNADLGGVLVCPERRSDRGRFGRAFFVTDEVEACLSVQLLLAGESPAGFRHVYPEDPSIEQPDVAVYELR